MWVGFNEAAARCRGKRGKIPLFSQPSYMGFNEAAARCRGKPVNRERLLTAQPGLQ